MIFRLSDTMDILCHFRIINYLTIVKFQTNSRKPALSILGKKQTGNPIIRIPDLSEHNILFYRISFRSNGVAWYT